MRKPGQWRRGVRPAPPRLVVQIDELVLHDVAPSSADRIGASVERGVTEAFAERGVAAVGDAGIHGDLAGDLAAGIQRSLRP